MKNFRDEELKKWLAEEYYCEADEMERILFPDGNIPEYEETEEETKAAYARLVERLKADGIYEEENNSYETDGHRGKNLKDDEKIKIVYLPARKQNRFVRVAAILAICVAGVFAAGMTSQANRSYFIDSVKLWTGNDTSISVDNEEIGDRTNKDEQGAIDSIKNELNIELMPQFMYRPLGFTFKSYQISREAGYAWLEYNYNGAVISVYINDYTDNGKSSDQLLDGKLLETIEEEDERICIKIIKVGNETDEDESYAAYWENQGIFYQISGKMEKKEFIKLIEKMHF